MKRYSSYKDQKLSICGEISVSQCGQLPNSVLQEGGQLPSLC